MNYLGRASILSAKEDCPIGLRIGYISELTFKECKEVEVVLDYWINLTAIAGSTVERLYKWNDEKDTVEVTTDFSEGRFKGNLLHHNAIEDGDDNFDIGLLKLLSFGYTDTGTTIPFLPFYVQFIYDDDIQEIEGRIRAEYQKLSINTILSDGKFIKEIVNTLNTITATLNAKYETGEIILASLIGANY